MQALFRNQGGFHVIGSGRDKIEKPDQLAAAAASAQAQDLDGLVVIGGDDSNTNAAVLAEYFLEQGGCGRGLRIRTPSCMHATRRDAPRCAAVCRLVLLAAALPPTHPPTPVFPPRRAHPSACLQA